MTVANCRGLGEVSNRDNLFSSTGWKRLRRNHGIITCRKRLMALTVCEKQMQIDAVHGIAFGRQIVQLSNQGVRFSLEDLSELVIARVAWTKSIQQD